MYSFTEENYLKTILMLSEQQDPVATNDIAKELDTKASSVTDMIKKLSDKRLVNYKKYHGTSLSQKGKRIALNIIRKHRLWEVFLVEKLQFNWDEVHEIAEQLEHIQSPELINRLDEFLDFPTVDPHGDPIPDSEGKFILSKEIQLNEASIGCQGVIVGVKDTSNDFLQYLDGLNIHLGTKIKVIQIFSYDKSMEVQINNSKCIMISEMVSKNISINEN